MLEYQSSEAVHKVVVERSAVLTRRFKTHRAYAPLEVWWWLLLLLFVCLLYSA
jgi:hypothetical protein